MNDRNEMQLLETYAKCQDVHQVCSQRSFQARHRQEMPADTHKQIYFASMRLQVDVLFEKFLHQSIPDSPT